MTSTSEYEDLYKAIHLAVDKLERQLEKAKPSNSVTHDRVSDINIKNTVDEGDTEEEEEYADNFHDIPDSIAS